MDRVAAIDLGSNTLRLLISEVEEDGRLRPVLLERRVTRLSQNLTPGRPLFPPAKARTLDVLEEFGRLTRRQGVERVFGGATAAVRLAADGDEFLAEILGRTGLSLKKLPGQEEARLTALGVLSGLNGLGGREGYFLVVDPGGGSTEFIPVEKGRIRPGVSLGLGVVGLCERFLKNDPPLKSEMAALTAAIQARLEELKKFYPPRPGLKLCGTAGTVTTIAAMLLELKEYDPAKVTGLSLGRRAVQDLLDRLAAVPVARRVGRPGLEAGREDVIVPGLVLVLLLMDLYGAPEMLVVDAGLLEGLILDGLKAAPPDSGAV